LLSSSEEVGIGSLREIKVVFGEDGMSAARWWRQREVI
jgi:hypothetical protein